MATAALRGAPGVAANGGAKETPALTVSTLSKKSEVGIQTLIGDYVERGTNHGKKYFQKIQAIEGHEDIKVFMYYWDARDGVDFAGWWFGDQLGGTQVWARSPSHTSNPPRVGWKIPWDADKAELGALFVDPYKPSAKSPGVAATAKVAAKAAHPAKAAATLVGNKGHTVAPLGKGGPTSGAASSATAVAAQSASASGRCARQLDAPSSTSHALPSSRRSASASASSGSKLVPAKPSEPDVGSMEQAGSRTLDFADDPNLGSSSNGADAENPLDVEAHAADGTQKQLGKRGFTPRESNDAVVQATDEKSAEVIVWEYASARSPESWTRFNSEDSAIVEAAYHEYCTAPNPQDGGGIIKMEHSCHHYTLDFRKMQQTNVGTGRVRCVRRRCSAEPMQMDQEAADLQNVAHQALERVRRLEEEKLEMQTAHDSQVRLFREFLEQKDQDIQCEMTKKHGLQADLENAKRQKIEYENRSRRIMDGMQCEIERWRQLTLGPTNWPHPDQHLRPHWIPEIQAMLRSLVPRAHSKDAKCGLACGVLVEHVYEIQNLTLWDSYCAVKKNVIASISERRECPWARDVLPRSECLRSSMSKLAGVEPDTAANEVFLLHGTKDKSVEAILHQGFDDRLSSLTLYGPGIYFTTDFCKAFQYAEKPDANRCSSVILARVVLGHPYLAEGPMKSHKRPPIVSGHGVPHDSVVARPGIPNGLHGGQIHSEAVVPSAQAYPELLIRFKQP